MKKEQRGNQFEIYVSAAIVFHFFVFFYATEIDTDQNWNIKYYETFFIDWNWNINGFPFFCCFSVF